MLRCALTIDDAPGPGGAAGGVLLMDAMRRTLERYRIAHCVAFVIGERVRGHEAELERWLASGFLLGNHSHEHPHASQLPARDFLRSVERCDALLHKLGAFRQPGPRYFRYPFGDRGAGPSERAAIRRGLIELGYTLADVSLSSYDYRYDRPMQAALAAKAYTRVAAIERRFAAQARATFARGQRITTLRTAQGAVRLEGELPHILALHFTGATTLFVDRMLSSTAAQVCWIGLDEAVRHSAYARFADDLDHNGIIADALTPNRSMPHTLAINLGRRGARVARKLGLLDEKRRGPRWPSWSD